MVDEAFERSKKFSITSEQGVLNTAIAAENVKVLANTVTPIRIELIHIPKNHTIQPCAYNRHPIGGIISVAEEKPRDVTENRSIEFVMFIAWENGTVEKGDVLGVVDTLPIKIEGNDDKCT
ncbi:MAG: DUF22 domain-containing protein [Halobacteriota archaeon]|nr:DUF22 domain-containing protein [Halobacteriota archaeon]